MNRHHALIIAALFVVGCGAGVIESTDSDSDSDDALASASNAQVCNNGTLRCFAHVLTDTSGGIMHTSKVSGLGPTDLASAYNFDPSLKPGATIAIVDAYGYPNLESDLAAYRSHFGLPACTVSSGCLKIVNQSGKTSPLPSAPSSDDDWTVETALDVDMASAACPNCKLLVVQVDDDQDMTNLFEGVKTAATFKPAVISNSWGAPEGDLGASAKSFETYLNHSGIAIFVAAGDDGYNDGGSGPDYPGTSAYVTAVGGTTLKKSSSASRGWSETVWGTSSGNGAGGSACSKSITKPSYQTQTACKYRASADVAAVGNPNTGLAVYNADSGGWTVVGGTSAASPLVAGIYALYGLGAKDPSFSYSHTGAYYDITSGSNGSCGNLLCKAGKGWDGPTGNGSPNGAQLKTAK